MNDGATNKKTRVLYKHTPGSVVCAEFRLDGNVRYRYRLEIALSDAAATDKTACVVMQNPSYACEESADKSVKFMETVVFEKGLPEFRGVRRLIVVNQFAKIQTNDFQGLPHEVGSLNDAAIKAALAESDIVILGWGSSNRFEERKAFVLGLLREMKGKTVFKTRMHPSRGRYEGFIQPYL